MSTLLVILAAILTAGFLVWRYPRQTEKAWRAITTLTGSFWALVVMAAAVFLIATMVFPYVIIGFTILVIGVLTLIFKRPDQTVSSYLKERI